MITFFTYNIFQARNNLLKNMNCIKRLSNLTELDLSNNKFTQISKNTFANLQSLTDLNFSFNKFKKLGPQMFATAKSLMVLKVDKFGGYKLVRKMSASLRELSLTTRFWDCTFVSTVAELLNKQRIMMKFNENKNVGNFTCPKSYREINKFQY